MATSKLKRLMGNKSHWTINKRLAFEIGLVETLVLQNLIDLTSFFKRGEIFQEYPTMQRELGLSEHKVRASIKKLEEFELLSIRKGQGNKNYYTLNEDRILEIALSQTSQLNSSDQSEGTQSVESNTLFCDNHNSRVVNTSDRMVKIDEQSGENQQTSNKNIEQEYLNNNIVDKNILNKQASVSSNDSPDGKLEVSPIKYSANKMDEFHDIFNDFQ